MFIRPLALPLFLFLFGFVHATPVMADEKLAQDHLAVMERFLVVLGAVKDVASAKRALPELERLSKRNESLFRQAQSLKISDETMVKYIQKNHKVRGEAIFNGIFAAMFTMSKVPEFEKIGEFIGKPVNELSNTTWASVLHQYSQ